MASGSLHCGARLHKAVRAIALVHDFRHASRNFLDGYRDRDSVTPKGSAGFDRRNIWVCDIKEKAGETDNDFLFCAHIDSDGMAGSKGQYCVFQNVIYDINGFTEDRVPDGSIDFGIHFGRNTAERPTSPNGWTIHCKVRQAIRDGFAQYAGTIATSWWGERDVTILRYASLSAADAGRYPDLVSSNYYRSRA